MIEETLCPICKTKMKSAKNKDGQRYWRCPRWGCSGTRDSMGRSKQDKQPHDEEDGANEVGHMEYRWDKD